MSNIGSVVFYSVLRSAFVIKERFYNVLWLSRSLQEVVSAFYRSVRSCFLIYSITAKVIKADVIINLVRTV